MQFKWLKQCEKNHSVIVIFSGWGFTAEVYKHLLEVDDNYDVIFVNDYRNLHISLPDLQHYQQRYLLAWSFGVASYSAWQQLQKGQNEIPSFDRMIAINGTMQAVDRFHGIPEVVMQKTINTLSLESFKVFAKRCFVSSHIPDDLRINVPERAQELQCILQRQHPEILNWDQVWIAKQDKIFPTKNLERAWHAYNQSAAKPVIIHFCDAPHAPFHLWSSWDDIINPD